MVESSTSRFQMVGVRSATLEGPIAEPIAQQIEAIENALESIPDFAFDLSKTNWSNLSARQYSPTSVSQPTRIGMLRSC